MRISADAFRQFNDDDGWAISSHIALSALMALFPFLIVVTALAAFFLGSKELADEAARILLEAWPSQVAEPIALDIRGVLTSTRGDVDRKSGGKGESGRRGGTRGGDGGV